MRRTEQRAAHFLRRPHRRDDGARTEVGAIRIMKWFRIHANLVESPKHQRISAELFRHWINATCLACVANGELPSLSEVAWRFRVTESKAKQILNALADASLLDVDGERFTVHDWNEWQYVSDVSTDRVRKFRERSRNCDETFRELDGNNLCNRIPSVSVSVSASEVKNGCSAKQIAAERKILKRKFFDEQIWTLCWRKTDKKKAWEAFESHVDSEEEMQHSVLAVKAAAAVYLKREVSKRPLMATWFNKERHMDDIESVQAELLPLDQTEPEYPRNLI